MRAESPDAPAPASKQVQDLTSPPFFFPSGTKILGITSLVADIVCGFRTFHLHLVHYFHLYFPERFILLYQYFNERYCNSGLQQSTTVHEPRPETARLDFLYGSFSHKQDHLLQYSRHKDWLHEQSLQWHYIFVEHFRNSLAALFERDHWC
jgi:hypothetical protein